MFKFPIPKNETERLGALKTYNLMDSGEDREFDAIASIASVICGIPISLITFIDENRQWFKSHIGTDLTENLRELSFCTHAIASGDEIMIVPDATKDIRFADNPIVTGPTKIVFYAGVALVNDDGLALGTICVLDQKVHELSNEQTEALKSLGKQVVDKIELRRKVEHLEKTNRELINSNLLIQKFASMAAHDIKNPLTSILLTSQLLRAQAEKPTTERSLKLIDVNISSAQTLLQLVDQMLAYSKAPGTLIARKQEIQTHGLFERMRNLIILPKGFVLDFQCDLDEIFYSAIAIEQILLNLLSNAIRYNDKEQGRIVISLNEETENYLLTVCDNGIGISSKYHQQIFESNFTLNGLDRFDNKGTGIGLSTVRDLVTMLNGHIAVDSTLGQGSTFKVTLKK